MATLINSGNGDWNANTTWLVAEAGSGAIQNDQTASTNTTTSYVASAAFTCTNADVLVGVLMHCKRVNTTGTVTIGLSDDNGVSYTREVTVNASDLPASQTWVLFKFASTLTADGGSDYKVAIKGSSAGNATFYRNSTAGNWAHILPTNANPAGAPAAADIIYIAGDWTAAATGSSYTVTMNAVAASIVDHGTLDIGQNGTLSYGTSASTAYYLRCSGNITVWAGGTLSIGTTGTPIPSTSTAILNLDCGSNVQYGLIVKDGGTFNAQGASMAYVWTYLASDEAANSTELTTADSTGWANNDEIAIASTTRTSSECEKGALNGAASGTTLTVDGFAGAGGGLAAAHSGTAPTRAEIINLTRNVQLFGASATFQAYILVNNTAVCDWDYAEFFWMGSATANKRGIDVLTTTGTFSANKCSAHDFAVANSYGFSLVGANPDNFTISDCVLSNIANTAIRLAATTGANWSLTGNVIVGACPAGFYLGECNGTVTGNIAVGGTNAFILDFPVSSSGGIFSSNTAHSCSGVGFSITYSLDRTGTYANWTSWRNNTVGINFASTLRENIVIDGIVAFGNNGVNIGVYSPTRHLTLKNIVSSGDSTFATATGLEILHYGTPAWLDLLIEDSTFGVVSGIKTAHTTDLRVFTAAGLVEIVCRNVNFASASPQNQLDGTYPNSFIRCQKYGQAAGDHRSFISNGTDTAVIQTDAAIYNTAAPSERIRPASASVKVESGAHCKAVANGGTATFTVYVRKSEAADAGGADYNGNHQRLMLRAAPALGVAAATLDTAVAVVGDWEVLTGASGAVNDDGVLEAYVDCDGTAGWINVDDWA